MARKSKQPGGHNPLTAHERKKYGAGYGTTTARLGQDSQYTFASCGLSLHPAVDTPVATPSGYIYEDYLQKQEANELNAQETKRKADVQDFENSQKVTSAKKRKTETNALKRSSYWLADMQPVNDETSSSNQAQRMPPPKRPPSPNTSRPLRRKDLVPLDLKRKPTKSGDPPVLCAISEKEISTQQALALVTKGGDEAQVVLESVYKDLKLDKERKPICPVTGRKIKQVLKLQKGGSAFASVDGSLEAKQYRPTMT
eukprot:CAMPEP_0116152408 /NCGR_PEP_ID=MMETSP0329-20121206/20631_1 /TAXON_ID=697910 /ORGANISM="Pseudo-nitzschia arenysensis, Strain B593" /LENGTH=255 /DNA_ID=CAMNT_0003649119 /DNA_START=73 /DNA_END=840 /DNA_ORIENTATION=+